MNPFCGPVKARAPLIMGPVARSPSSFVLYISNATLLPGTLPFLIRSDGDLSPGLSCDFIMFGYSGGSRGVARGYLKPLPWGLPLQMGKAILRAAGHPAFPAQRSWSSGSFGAFMPWPGVGGSEVANPSRRLCCLLMPYFLPCVTHLCWAAKSPD